MKKLFIVAGIVALAGSAMAQDAVKTIKPDSVAWKGNPLLKGVESAVLLGDPTKAEVVIVRNKLAPNTKIPPHTHPNAEVVTVISGSVGFGHGDAFDTSKGEVLKVGSVVVNPAKQSHFLWTGGEETVIQVQFTGPTGFDFINAADDPRKK